MQDSNTRHRMGLQRGTFPWSLCLSASVLSALFFAGCAQDPGAATGEAPGLALPSGYRTDRVALAIQGKKVDLQRWIGLYEQMRSKDSVTLHFVSYDSPHKCPTGMVCHFLPNSTWSMGRNELARRILQSEAASGLKYKYWAFHDADTWDLHCSVCRYGISAQEWLR